MNVPCYHGAKLPDVGKDAQAFWNGKSWSLELGDIRCTQDPDGTLVLHPTITCRWCRNTWRSSWEKVWPYIHDEKLKHNIQQEPGRFARLADEQFLNRKERVDGNTLGKVANR